MSAVPALNHMLATAGGISTRRLRK